MGGVDELSTRTAAALYKVINKKGVIPVSNATTAEAVKVFEGIYRDVNIALASQLALVCSASTPSKFSALRTRSHTPICTCRVAVSAGIASPSIRTSLCRKKRHEPSRTFSEDKRQHAATRREHAHENAALDGCQETEGARARIDVPRGRKRDEIQPGVEDRGVIERRRRGRVCIRPWGKKKWRDAQEQDTCRPTPSTATPY